MTNRRPVVFVLPDGLTLGGVTTWSLDMCRRLMAMEQPCTIVRHASTNPPLDVELPPGLRSVDCTSAPHPGFWYIRTRHIRQYRDAYRSALPAVLVPNWSFGTYAACAALARRNARDIRIIGFAHTDEENYYRWLQYYEPIIHRFIAVSEEIGERLSEMMPERTDDIIVRPYPVDVTSELERNYTPASEPLRLIYAGRLAVRQKRIFDLAELARMLSESGVSFHLRIFGEGPDGVALRERISTLPPEVQSTVTVEGSVAPERMPDVWRASDALVLVSETEGTSIAMIEAMAEGTVPVVTKVSGTGALIRHGENGFAVAVGDLASMVEAIRALEQDRSRLAEMGRKAHNTVSARPGYDAYEDWFCDLVDEVWTLPDRAWPRGLPVQWPGTKDAVRFRIKRAIRGDLVALDGVVRRLSQRKGFRWVGRMRDRVRRLLP